MASPPPPNTIVVASSMTLSPVLAFTSDQLEFEEEPEAGAPVGVGSSTEVVRGVAMLSRPDKAPSESVVNVVSTDSSWFNVVGPFPFINNDIIVLEV